MGARLWVLVAAVAALTLTLLVSVTALVHFAYRNPSLHVAVETAAGLISLVAAQLMLGRFHRTLQLGDLLLAAALAVLAFSNLVLSVGSATAHAESGTFGTWAPVLGRLLGAGLFSAGALAPERVLHRPDRALARVGLVCLTVVGLIVLGVTLAGDALPAAVPPDLSPGSLTRPRLVGNPFVLSAQGVSMVLYAAAAWGFARRAERSGGVFMSWLAVAATLAAFAWLNYVLFPSLYSPWFYIGDGLRLASFLALLVGGGLELRRTQAELAAAAVFEERRRLARDLHDGVTQGLAFIIQHGRHMIDRGGPASLERLVATAEGALDESRHAISALRRPPAQQLSQVIALTAEEVAGREGGTVETDIAPEVSVPADAQAALLRIVREATINALRHGGAQRVRIELSEKPAPKLAIIDDGCGFDVDAARGTPGRVGLHTMAERAAAIGAELVIRSGEGRGTRVEVLLP